MKVGELNQHPTLAESDDLDEYVSTRDVVEGTSITVTRRGSYLAGRPMNRIEDILTLPGASLSSFHFTSFLIQFLSPSLFFPPPLGPDKVARHSLPIQNPNRSEEKKKKNEDIENETEIMKKSSTHFMLLPVTYFSSLTMIQSNKKTGLAKAMMELHISVRARHSNISVSPRQKTSVLSRQNCPLLGEWIQKSPPLVSSDSSFQRRLSATRLSQPKVKVKVNTLDSE